MAPKGYISIHALRVEGDTFPSQSHFSRIQFLSTPSGWRATSTQQFLLFLLRNFYPRPPGGGRHKVGRSELYSVPISIHALRVEGDLEICHSLAIVHKFLSTPSGWRATASACGSAIGSIISIHALRVEGDQRVADIDILYGNFYPRPPGGGRLHPVRVDDADVLDFYPRPPGGGRPSKHRHKFRNIIFLSTPSGWRATSVFAIMQSSTVTFLSTPSGWRATPTCWRRRSPARYFYPRPPGGGRRSSVSSVVRSPLIFLSTPSGWRATRDHPRGRGAS